MVAAAGRPVAAAVAGRISTRWATCAGLFATTIFSSRRMSTEPSSTASRTTTVGRPDPGRSAPGAADHATPPLSSTVGRTPTYSSIRSASPSTVPRRSYSLTALATSSRWRSSGHVWSSSSADPPGQPFDEVDRGELRVEVGPEVVDRRRHRGQHRVEPVAEPLRERVVVEHRRQRLPDRSADPELRRAAPWRSSRLHQDLVLVAEHERVAVDRRGAARVRRARP